MDTIGPNEDLSRYIGKKLSIKKLGADGKEYVLEGVLTGRGIAVLSEVRDPVVHHWVLDKDGTEHHFAPSEWDISCL